MDSPRRFVSSPAYPLRRKESTEPRCGKKRRRDLGILRAEKSIDHTGLSTFTQPRHESKFHPQHVRFSMKSEIQQSFDTDLTRQDVQDLSSADAVTAFFARLGYDTGTRTPQPLAISELPQTARPGRSRRSSSSPITRGLALGLPVRASEHYGRAHASVGASVSESRGKLSAGPDQ